MLAALRGHWPEYVMEALGLGIFMFSAVIGTALIWNVNSPLEHLVANQPFLQRMLMGIAMGLTAVFVIYSPIGKRSGAHINPCVTLAFLRLGKVAPTDALFYIIAQFIGALLGVYAGWLALGNWISSSAVNYAVTVPGTAGFVVAFVAEATISFGVMAIVLWSTNMAHLARFTGLMIGVTLVVYITFEAPLSGMSMNPARTVGSALPAGVFTGLWIYFLAPPLGMLLAAELYLRSRGADAVRCAKLYHTRDVRCIFKCGYALGMETTQNSSHKD